MTGSVPTENLPVKSHEKTKKVRRTLMRASVEETASSSTASTILSVSTIDEFLEHLHVDDEAIFPWKVDKSKDDGVRIELYDNIHSIAKYTVTVDSVSYSKMKVKLATQVLSRSMAIALQESVSEEVLGTARFCMMMNDFFDCTNVRSRTEHVRKRNQFIKPYTTQDDERLTWLKDVPLKYLDDWKNATLSREGKYSPADRGKMFLSLQTYEGLRIAVHSHVEAIQFLLAEGFEYVLSERFMQDVLEDYFGHQRAKGGRSDNPTAQQFGYNDLTIAAQRDIAPVVRGNVGGRYEKQKWYKVSEEPVRKRKK